jgi:hypothetical protein
MAKQAWEGIKKEPLRKPFHQLETELNPRKRKNHMIEEEDNVNRMR